MIDKLLRTSEAVNRGGLVLLGQEMENLSMFSFLAVIISKAAQSLNVIKSMSRIYRRKIISLSAVILQCAFLARKGDINK